MFDILISYRDAENWGTPNQIQRDLFQPSPGKSCPFRECCDMFYAGLDNAKQGYVELWEKSMSWL